MNVESETSEYFDLMAQETDRAAVILAGAILDKCLLDLLISFFVPIDNPDKNDFFDSGALGTFSAKIKLSFRLGLISKPLESDLNSIRKIGNAFAHDLDGCTFDDQAVADRITTMIKRIHESHKQYYESHFPLGPRGEFMMIVDWIRYNLEISSSFCERRVECNPEFAYTSGFEGVTENFRELLKHYGALMCLDKALKTANTLLYDVKKGA